MKRALLISGIMIILSFTISFGQLSLNKPTDKQIIMNTMKSQPLCFTENRGQWGDKTLFKAEANGATFYFCKDEVAYLFTRNTDEIDLDAKDPRENKPGFPAERKKIVYKKEALLIKAQFVGANENVEATGEDRLSHNCNYFYGNDPGKWATDVPNYSSIIYKDIYPGIDLRYYGNGTGIKYDFIVNPGADISRIRICYEEVNNLSISNTGDLRAQTRFGLVYENIPLAYQIVNGYREEVSGRYIIRKMGEFGFEVDGYNTSYSLVIDPELIYSTFLGGNLSDFVGDIEVDSLGNTYITGTTSNSDFPVVNPYDGIYNGNGDVYVLKFLKEGDSLIYSTFLGGSSYDFGYSLAVSPSGNVYVAGTTGSTNFPTINAYDASNNGASDGFVAKLSSNGNTLTYSTYLGGNGSDAINGVDLDPTGKAYVAGVTESSNFPTVNPYNGIYAGSTDGFVTKLSSSGSSLVYCLTSAESGQIRVRN